MAHLLNHVRSLPLPPVRNLMNVAAQAARQVLPVKPSKSDYEQPRGPGGDAPPVPPRPQQNVHFADQQGDGKLRLIHFVCLLLLPSLFIHSCGICL